MENPIIYLAAPYGHSDPAVIETRMSAVTRHLAELAAEGKVAFSPLLMHFCLNSGIDLPGDYEFWKNFCLTMLRKSDILLVLALPGWEESVGVLDEIEFAKAFNIPIEYSAP
jgi:hypothetical protein